MLRCLSFSIATLCLISSSKRSYFSRTRCFCSCSSHSDCLHDSGVTCNSSHYGGVSEVGVLIYWTRCCCVWLLLIHSEESSFWQGSLERGTYWEVDRDVVILGVVNDVVLVFVDDVHRGENVESVVHSALHIFEVHFLADLLIKRLPRNSLHHKIAYTFLESRSRSVYRSPWAAHVPSAAPTCSKTQASCLSCCVRTRRLVAGLVAFFVF
jgi:hypothetical protein